MSEIYDENITGQVSSTASISGEAKDTSPPFKMIFPCNSVADFPTAGKENALYIDKSVNPNIAYRWDAEESAYIMVGGAGSGGGNFILDTTLTASGSAADAAAVGAALNKKSNSTHSHTASEVGADASGAATSAVNAHNVNALAHNDIRLLFEGLSARLNALADSDDTTLDQLSEIVAYIQANRGLIESVTTAKVNTSDIIDNLETNVSNKPLSAAQGVALKQLIDAFTVPSEVMVDVTDEEGIANGATLLLDSSAMVDPDSIFMTAAEVPAVVSNYVGDVLLWENKENPWKSGDLTIAASGGSDGCTCLGNLSDYEKVVIIFGDVFADEGYKSATTLRGGFGVNAANGTLYTYGYYFTVNGNTLTHTKVTRQIHTSSGSAETYTGGITAIYGRPSRRT